MPSETEVPENFQPEVNHIRSVLSEANQRAVDLLLGEFANQMREDIQADLSQGLIHDIQEQRLFALARLVMELCYGTDPSKGIRLGRSLILYIEGHWKQWGDSPNGYEYVVYASIVSSTTYGSFQEGKWPDIDSLLEEVRVRVPAIVKQPAYWNAIALYAITLIRANKTKQARRLLESAPFHEHTSAQQLTAAWKQLETFERKRFLLDLRLPLAEQAETIWNQTFTSNLETLQRIRAALEVQPGTDSIKLDLEVLSELETTLRKYQELADQPIPFEEKYFRLATENERWCNELSRFICRGINWNRVNHGWVARTLNSVARVQANTAGTVQDINEILVNLKTAHQWSTQCGDLHSVWMAHWAILIVNERLQRWDACRQEIDLICKSISKCRVLLEDLETSSNVANYLYGLASKACKIHDHSPCPNLLMYTLELRRSRSLLACKADNLIRHRAAWKQPAALGLKTHYIGYSVLHSDDRIQATLYTADGQFSTEKINLDIATLKEQLNILNPDDWHSFWTLGNPCTPIDVLTPLVAPLKRALNCGLIQENDHICVASEDPVSLIPLHYLIVDNRMLVSRVSISRVASFSDAVVLSREKPLRPKHALAVFVDSVARSQELRRGHFRTVTSSLEQQLGGSVRRFDPVAVTASELLAQLQPRRIIHVHAHGYFEHGSNPFNMSGLVVSDGVGLPILDGDLSRLLTPSQVYERKPNLRGAHITLSACVSGLGLEGQGGDVLGMEMVLRLCGASSVLATHWDVVSSQVTDFSKKFYELWLGSGLPRGQAWRKSIEFFINNEPNPGAKAQWCAFSLFGGWH